MFVSNLSTCRNENLPGWKLFTIDYTNSDLFIVIIGDEWTFYHKKLLWLYWIFLCDAIVWLVKRYGRALILWFPSFPSPLMKWRNLFISVEEAFRLHKRRTFPSHITWQAWFYVSPFELTESRHFQSVCARKLNRVVAFWKSRESFCKHNF